MRKIFSDQSNLLKNYIKFRKTNYSGKYLIFNHINFSMFLSSHYKFDQF